MSTSPDARAWIRVRADALRRNYRRIRASVGPVPKIIPMVKADAYGLGVREVVRALSSERPAGWGVATIDEGLTLRELGLREPIIVCSPTAGAPVADALAAGLELTVSSLEALAEIAASPRAAGAAARMHLDVDTGMGRSGFDWRNAREWLPKLLAAEEKGLKWVGCQTHMHSADESDASVREQLTRFDEVLKLIGDRLPNLMVHLLNSAGALRLPSLARTAVRPGIFLYGGRVGPGQPEPEAVVSLHARVIHVRDAQPGTTLGYGATYQAKGPERWATLGIGYGDGLPRSLGNRGQALVCGRRVRIIGRISMDMTVVDITGVPGIRGGDVATLLGTEGGESITVDEVAELAGTISYEVLTGLTRRLPRVWTGLDSGS